MEIISLDIIKPAPYNPRSLEDAAFEMLKQSIKELGVIKPIIVNKKNNIIIAGHQRTKAMKALGIKECPAFVLDVQVSDEIRFNQLHNKCEYEISDKAPKVRIKCKLTNGFQRVSCKDVEILDNGKLGAINNNLSLLLLKYGDFGCPICDASGDVFVSAAYARASKILGKDLWVYCSNDKDKIVEYMKQTYGEFSYDNLKRTTWHQSYAQMYRIRNGRRKLNISTLYSRCVIPFLEKNKNLSVLDFGAGEKDYCNRLVSQGYDIIGVDPYHKKRGSKTIDVNGNTIDYLEICEHIKKKGLFDVAVCDSVLNSVDSKQGEINVVNTLRALCKDGGLIFVSGRVFEFVEYQNNRDTAINIKQSDMRFYDKNNFSAIFRNGEWFYQHCHNEQQRQELLDIIGEGKINILHDRKSSFQIVAQKTKPILVDDALDALMAEFDMPLPNGKSYGLQNKIKEAYLYAISNNKNI